MTPSLDLYEYGYFMYVPETLSESARNSAEPIDIHSDIYDIYTNIDYSLY